MGTIKKIFLQVLTKSEDHKEQICLFIYTCKRIRNEECDIVKNLSKYSKVLIFVPRKTLVGKKFINCYTSRTCHSKYF